MEQNVYMDLDTYNNIQQHQQFQSQGIMMSSGNDPSMEVVQDVDQPQQQQHVVYTAMKQSEPQYGTQDDPMQGQYIIQSPSQPQQVFYANIPQNRLQQQQQSIAHIMQQNSNQQKLVVQPKVVVQRNGQEMLQSTNMAQIVDHQNQQTIQYHFAPQIDQSQGQQIIIQQQPTQQIKQTIYPQQPNQVLTQSHYFQLQPNVIQQGGAKLVMQNNQLRYHVVPKPQQQVQQIAVQNPIMPMNQQSPQQPQGIRQFRPRVMTPRMQSPVAAVPRQRPPKPRVVRPQAHNPLIQQVAPRPMQQPNKMVYMLQTQPDGSQVLVPHPQYQQNQQIVRIQQKIVQPQPQPQQHQQQQYQVVQNQLTEMVQEQPQPQPQPMPRQMPPPPEEPVHVPPTTSTFTPKKDGDCDDLEESITATAISKSARSSEPPPLQPQSGSISIDDYRKRLLQPNRVGVVRPIMNTAGNQLRAPPRNPALQVIRQRPAPRPQYQLQGAAQEVEIQERESAKMLVILDNGEQRLITFTLPKETCTVQELLDQVGIQVGADSNIECIENPGSEIDYIVKVGNFASRDTAAMTKAAENHIRQQQVRQQQLIQNQRNSILQQTSPQANPPQPEVSASQSPEPKVVPPKYVAGFFAVCAACGCSGVDHAKCMGCHRVFTEEPKMQRMPSTNIQTPQKLSLPVLTSPNQTIKILATARSAEKKDHIEALQKKHQMTSAQKQGAGRGGRGGATGSARGRGARGKAKAVVPEIVTLSSDEEDGSDESKSSAKKPEEIVPKKHFEPEIVEEPVADDFIRQNVEEFGANEKKMSTSIACRTIRIGTYKFDSKNKVMITSKGIKIHVPSLKPAKDLLVINIQQSEIVKVVVHFSKQLHIIFLYTKPSCARYINELLGMNQTNDKSPFYSPMSRLEPQRKIVFLAEAINEETKSLIKSIYSRMTLEEITNRDANEMLVRSTGIPLTSTGAPTTPAPTNSTESSMVDIETRKLLIYPPGRGGIAITTNDYACLAADVYLNDVIIDFYLKYLHQEVLTPAQSEKSYMFSQFFYKRLTQVSKEKDPKLSAAQKRHARVATWTKNVNIFEKDFIIIPINEQSHWFLAIICFANLSEPHTMDTNQPIKLNPPAKRAKKKTTALQIGSTTITPLNKKDETISIGDEADERDEAEGSDDDLGSNLDSEEEEEVIDRGQPVKVPCILIFDSLLGAPRNRVVATLRDYLTCEYKAKYPDSAPRVFNKANIFGNQVRVPQQNNFTDCGVFLLQYVEQFFTDPLKDYRIPLKSQLVNWFDQDIVTRKREEIAILIDKLIRRSNPDGLELPVIEFPTKDGKILEASEEGIVESAFDDEEYLPTEEDLSENGSKPQQVEVKTRILFPKKRSLDKNESSSGESSAKTPKLSSKNKSFN